MVKINVSEHFYSIQGEGKTMGVPSIFLRLQACNLLCAWPCDTIEVWKKGNPYTPEELVKLFEEKGYFNEFEKGAYLILTGGEPLLQQEGFVKFWEAIPFNYKPPYIEVETNGTIMPTEEFSNLINHFNCSPKTSNSRMSKERRYKPEVLEELAWNENNIFKFVIDKEEDMKEIVEDFIVPFKIKPKNVYLMPQCITRDELHLRQPMVTELAKLYGFNYSDRLQVSIWNLTTGV